MNKTKIEKTAARIWSKFMSKYETIKLDQETRAKNMKLKQINEDEMARLLQSFLAAVSMSEIKKIINVEELEMEEILKVCDYAENIYFHIERGNLSKSQAEVHAMVKGFCIL